MNWQTAQAPLIFFEDEDEAELISQFVNWRAKHPDYSVFAICEHIFRNLKDNTMRANQAALAWQADLTITERIDAAKRNGGSEPETLTKEQWQAEVTALTRNENIGAQAKTAMMKGYQLIGESNGWIVKAVEKKTADVTNRRPTIVIAQANAA